MLVDFYNNESYSYLYYGAITELRLYTLWCTNLNCQRC